MRRAMQMWLAGPQLSSLLGPDEIAKTYVALHRQHRSAWTQELDLRPSMEKFSAGRPLLSPSDTWLRSMSRFLIAEASIDFLFINADILLSLQPFDQVTEASFDRQFDVNTKGAFFTVQRLSPFVPERRFDPSLRLWPTVLPGGNLGVFCGTKAALRAFAR